MVTFDASPTFDLTACCAQCGREAEVPEGGGRFPVKTEGGVIINGDGPCDQCGSTRLKVRFELGDDP